MIDFGGIRWMTFDCYGTLIDWESGILASLKPLLTRAGVAIPDEEILEQYAAFEAAAESGPYQSYRMVLCHVIEEFGRNYGFSVTDVGVLADSLPGWKPFADTVEALKSLKKRFRLAVISNIDDDLFAQTARQLVVPFDAVVTAQSVRSYKPSEKNFLKAIELLGGEPGKILHVAQSLYHDIATAGECGMTTVWVNRRKGKHGFGATPASFVKPDLEVPDLQTLVGLAV